MKIMVGITCWMPGQKVGEYSSTHTVSEPHTGTAISEAQDWADKTIRTLATRAGYEDPVEDHAGALWDAVEDSWELVGGEA